MGYKNTFIAVAADCRATGGEMPPQRAGGPTVAGTQYALLAGSPGRWTEEDVLLAPSPGVRAARTRLRSDPALNQLPAMRSRRSGRPQTAAAAAQLST